MAERRVVGLRVGDIMNYEVVLKSRRGTESVVAFNDRDEAIGFFIVQSYLPDTPSTRRVVKHSLRTLGSYSASPAKLSHIAGGMVTVRKGG